MRVFKAKDFARFARKEGIDDAALCEAVARAARGLFDAELGGGPIKQRVARKGEGRSGGFRTIVAIGLKDRAVFVHGFAKRDSDNIRQSELAGLKALASAVLSMNARQIDDAIAAKEFLEVNCNGQEIQK